MNEEFLTKRGRTIPNKTPLSVEVKKSIQLLIFTLLVIIILVSIVFLLNSSQSNQKGYSLKQQQLLKEELIENSRSLVNRIIDAKAFSSIQENPQLQQMQKPEDIIYLPEQQE